MYICQLYHIELTLAYRKSSNIAVGTGRARQAGGGGYCVGIGANRAGFAVAAHIEVLSGTAGSCIYQAQR
jgi:hypothetical protein